MRTTITLDDDLFAEAAACCESTATPSMVIKKACETLVEIEAAKRLMKLSGTAPDFSVPPRSKRTTDIQQVAEPHGPYGSES